MADKADRIETPEFCPTTKKRLDAARDKYDALRRSYEKLLSGMDQPENALSSVGLSSESSRRV